MKKQYIYPCIEIVMVDVETLLAAESPTNHNTNTTTGEPNVPETGGGSGNSTGESLSKGNSFWEDEW